jgi:radical SAM protein with 4Fe4S-binding SPASM domain
MKEQFIVENEEFFKTFLESTFFDNWRNSTRDSMKHHNYSSIEFSLGYACDLSCSYCYYTRYGKELYGKKSIKKENVLSNVEKVMKFIVKNNMLVNIEIFAGEIFVISYIWDIFDIILKHEAMLPVEKRPFAIIAPSNMSFLKEGREEIFDKFAEYRQRFAELDIFFGISASVDGPFLDNDNRPSKTKKPYTKEFYEKLISYGTEFDYGYHPMIYSTGIEHWIDNYLWFAQNIQTNLYLLEVRNAEWNTKQSKQLYYFMKFLVHKIFKDSNENHDSFLEFLGKRGTNIIESTYSTIGRGIGCSLQSTLQLNMNELSLSSCHRLAYDYLQAGTFDFHEDGGYDFNPGNVEMYIATHAVDSKSMVPCDSCAINELCSAGCLGANLEATGDAFINPPTMCAMEHAKILGIFEAFEEIGIVDRIYSMVPIRKASQIKNLLKMAKKEIA